LNPSTSEDQEEANQVGDEKICPAGIDAFEPGSKRRRKTGSNTAETKKKVAIMLYHYERGETLRYQFR